MSRLRAGRTVIKVTHEFVEDPAGVNRAYDTWALLLARSLNLDTGDTEQQLTRATRRGRTKQGSA